MARYFIHILDGKLVRDEEGEDFRDLAAVRTAALRTLGETLRSREERFWDDGALRIFIEDANGDTVVSVEARDLLSGG